MGHLAPGIILIVSTLCVSERNEGYATMNKIQELLNHPFSFGYRRTNVSERCLSDSQNYLEELANNTLWALKMFDSSSKLQSGLGAGNIVSFGNYDECVEAAGAGFRGQHCTASIRFVARDGSRGALAEALMLFQIKGAEWRQVGESLIRGVCVPSSCSALDVQLVLRARLVAVDPAVQVTVDPRDCHVRQRQPWTAAERSLLVFLAIFAVLLVISTVYDRCLQKKCLDKKEKNCAEKCLTAFSLPTNLEQLLRSDDRAGAISCLSGIRFLSVVWVVLLHEVLLVNKIPLVNRLHLVRIYTYPSAVVLSYTGKMSTDTFLLLGGFLLAYTFMNSMMKGSSFNIFTFYLGRYLRITPAYAAVVFFNATVLVRMGSGPLWGTMVGTLQKNCVTNWWYNLLYVNNYLNNGDDMCMKPSWYLAVDMQLYLFSPLVLYPLWKWPRAGVTLLAMALAASIATPAAIVFAKHVTWLATARMGFTGTKSYSEKLVYLPAHTRASPYLVGIAFGYWLHSTRESKVVLQKWLVIVGWMAAIAVILSLIYGPQGMFLETHHVGTLEAISYAGLSSFAWSVALVWIIFACNNGHGGLVNTILSMRVMRPLSRLTYCIYLCHHGVLLWRGGSTRTSKYFSMYDVVSDVFGDMPLLLVISAAVCLTFEMPIANICKACMGNSDTQKPSHSSREGHPEISRVTENHQQPQDGDFQQPCTKQ